MKTWPIVPLAAYLALLMLGVLTPQPPPVPLDPLQSTMPPEGLVADAVRNLVLFVPLGWLLTASRCRPTLAVAVAFVLSIAIELLQDSIPGRHTSVVDVATNTLGTALGAVLFNQRRRWLRPGPRESSRWAIGFVLLASTVLAAGVQLFRLSTGGPEFYASLRPELGNYERFGGEILAARIGTLELTPGRLADAQAFTRAMTELRTITIRAETGSASHDLAPLILVHDSHQREILIVAAQGNDLVAGWRTWAEELGFEQPLLRWHAGLVAGQPDRSFEIELEREPASAALTAGGQHFGRRSWTPGSLWSLLIPARTTPAYLTQPLECVAIALLAFPCFYYARRWLWVALWLAVLLALLTRIGPVALPVWTDWLGLTGGALLGRVARFAVARLPSTWLEDVNA